MTQSVFSGICLTRYNLKSRTQVSLQIPLSISIHTQLILYSQVSVLQDTTQSGTQGSHEYYNQYQSGYNSLYSQVSVLQDTTQSGTQGSHQYHCQYQSGYNSVCILRYLSDKIQLHQELKVHMNIIVKYQSIYNSVCILRNLSYKIQLKIIPN